MVMKKKGVSPVVATVLLVAMVIVIALIIFIWIRSIGGETITKFGGENVKIVCERVEFSVEYYGGSLTITNNGNVPIYRMKVKITEGGDYETKDLVEIPNSLWPDSGLRSGGVLASGDLSSEFSNADTLVLIPVILGTSDEGEKSHTCDENSAGRKVFIF